MRPLTRRTALLTALATPALAQAPWPTRPLLLVVPFPAGGTGDVLCRLLQPRLAAALGQPVTVDNRPGGGTTIGTDFVAHAPPDGHTLLLVANSFTINATLVRNPSFDARHDLAAAASIGFTPHVLVTAPGSGLPDVAAVVAAARATPGGVFYASFGNGTSGHLGAALFAREAGVELAHVPYRGEAPALQDVVAGRVTVMLANLPEALPLVQDGRLRALAIADAARSPLLPEVPTFPEAGYPGVISQSWFGLVIRAGAPAIAAERLDATVNAALADPALGERLARVGVIPRPLSVAQFAAFLTTEFDRNGRIVRDARITLD